MSALPRPDVPPGPRRELVDALHELHHRAGWPSLRSLAGEAGCSHTTVSATFSTPRLPTWGILELLVEAMGGDVTWFRQLWLAASAAADGSSPTAGAPPRIAGRRDELVAVRRHLETGTGLLLVTGEAGIGKTRLVTTAAALVPPDRAVAVGPCLPLSTSTALLPLLEALRGLLGTDPETVRAAVRDSPAYVAPTLARLLPDLGEAVGEPVDEWSRHHLFLAISTVLARLHQRVGLALLIEDLHWADTATLALVEHLVTTAGPVPIVGTWRTDDPGLSDDNVEWFVRVRRMSRVVSLNLPHLTREETRDQLVLLAQREPSDAAVQAIHTRTRGQPLFTEQLASQATDGVPLPSLLADLLDDRLGDLDGPQWLAARTLGVAERPLEPTVLGAASGLAAEDLTSALRDLDRRRLLAPARGRKAELRHPLLADAIRRRLVVGEAAQAHARLATVLAAEADPEPGEVARHWQGAGDDGRELPWRIAAARREGERFAAREAFDSWRRVLELWPPDTAHAGAPPISLCEVYVRAIDVALVVADVDEVRRLVHEAMRLEVPDEQRVEVLRLAGDVECAVGDVDVGLTMLDEALTIHERLPATAELVHLLRCRASNLSSLGRLAEAWTDIRRALDVANEIDDPFARRRMLTDAAWHRAAEGHFDEARSLARAARALPLPRADPVGDIDIGVTETDILLQAGAPAEVVAEAAVPGLEAAERWQLATFHVAILRFNVCEAYLRAGDVSTAATLVGPDCDGEVLFAQVPLHVGRAAVLVRRGHLPEALVRYEAVSAMPGPYSANRAEVAVYHADAELWAGLAEPAAARVGQAQEFLLGTEAAGILAAILSQHARAQADLLASGRATPDARAAVARRLTAAVTRAGADPFGPGAVGVAVPAHGTTWAAELARVSGTATTEDWTRAAAEWDRLTRPHDAAYCRWRAAQVALESGQGTVAARLLRRAATDARQHVPLLAAIAELSGLSPA